MSFDSPLPPYNASDPSATFLASSCFDFLLIELVPMAYRLTHELDEREKDGMAGYTPENVPSSQSVSGSSKAGTATTKATGQGTIQGGVRPPGSGMGGAMDEDEERDAVFFRLESQGYRVGLGSYTPPPPFLSFPFLSFPSALPPRQLPLVFLSLSPLFSISPFFTINTYLLMSED